MQPKTAELEAAFNKLVKQWHRETDLSSFADVKVAHPAYQQIIKMGEPALPLIFREMEANGGHWFNALETITGANPVTKDMWGKVMKLREVWLQWGREHGYRW